MPRPSPSRPRAPPALCFPSLRSPARARLPLSTPQRVSTAARRHWPAPRSFRKPRVEPFYCPTRQLQGKGAAPSRQASRPARDNPGVGRQIGTRTAPSALLFSPSPRPLLPGGVPRPPLHDAVVC
eukprot:359061-Chlamydomonas_euryale.AAC.3